MTDAVVAFADPACHDVELAGGKGASLAAMAAAGLPVPPGFIVAAGVLEDCVDAELLRPLAAAGDHARAQALVALAEPPRAAIAAAYERLGRGQVAVRSSACAEDSQAASYAGQQDTYLHVEGVDEVCRRVVECWASFFSERALFYRSHKGDGGDLRIAVVVQRMLDSAKAGVGFTVDPVQKRRDHMIVEAVVGQGEQLVSGQTTPAHYVLGRDGTLRHEVLANGAVLDAEELRAVAELGRRLEERFGTPQDFEWAIAGGQLYVLQSRPVTTL